MTIELTLCGKSHMYRHVRPYMWRTEFHAHIKYIQANNVKIYIFIVHNTYRIHDRLITEVIFSDK